MKLLIKKLIRHFGYELMTLSYAANMSMLWNLKYLFKRFKINLVLDVGANRGQFRDFLRKDLEFKGNIISFEPIRELQNELKKRAKNDKLWEIRELALGAEIGRQSFNVATTSLFSSFLNQAERIGHIGTARTEIINVETIDHLGPNLFTNTPPEQSFLKLDTQGFDLEVMKGGLHYLQKFALIMTEVPFIHCYENMNRFDEILNFLRDRGFDLVGMWPVSRDGLFRVLEFDCLVLNRALAEKTGEMGDRWSQGFWTKINKQHWFSRPKT